ncbi:AAA family ATPase [Streptomyces cyaneofuscatus]
MIGRGASSTFHQCGSKPSASPPGGLPAADRTSSIEATGSQSARIAPADISSRTSSQSTVRHRSAQLDEEAAAMEASGRPRSDGVSSNCACMPSSSRIAGMRPIGTAAALLGDPAVVMLDEPSNGLDPEGIIWIRELMKRLAREGRTVLVSSHLMNETASFADHLVVLGRGRLLADLPMREFLDSRSRPRVHLRTTEQARLRSALATRGLTAAQAEDGRWVIDGVTAAAIGTLAAGEGIPLLELADERATLEQAYFDLTSDDTPFAASTTSTRQEARP